MSPRLSPFQKALKKEKKKLKKKIKANKYGSSSAGASASAIGVGDASDDVDGCAAGGESDDGGDGELRRKKRGQNGELDFEHCFETKSTRSVLVYVRTWSRFEKKLVTTSDEAP